ncbi:hypothetical protein HDV06_002881 [Boothiomyces sp. JEL0866]|nr:hypothetical protein HDV06_002881 [Boothiomyces sp. JEL0866]
MICKLNGIQANDSESDVVLSDCDKEVVGESLPITRTGLYSSVLLPPSGHQNKISKPQITSNRKDMPVRVQMSPEEKKKYEADTINSIFAKSILAKKKEPKENESKELDPLSWKSKNAIKSTRVYSQIQGGKQIRTSFSRDIKQSSDSAKPKSVNSDTVYNKRMEQMTRSLYSHQSKNRSKRDISRGIFGIESKI